MDIETRRFRVPLQRYVFPLTPGQTWNQWVDDFNESTRKDGQINRYVRVGGWETVVDAGRQLPGIAAARLHAARRRRILARSHAMQLSRLVRARGGRHRARGEARPSTGRRAQPHGTGAVRAQHTVMQLVSFRHGA